LVFDYFTALPLNNVYNPLIDFDPAERSTTMPTVDQAGLRVHGRVSINAAPWKVLAGVPRAHADELPIYNLLGGSPTFPQIADTDGDTATPEVLGANLAQTIVAYRDRRDIPGIVSYATVPERGFLTIGELAFASGASDDAYNFDAGNTTDYLQAAARLVALSDWVTTRGHVFTIYGQIRGVGDRSVVDSRAIRFQETVDRLPSMFDGSLPRRIGRRTVGAYNDARSD
jgi:hypothetical protein